MEDHREGGSGGPGQERAARQGGSVPVRMSRCKAASHRSQAVREGRLDSSTAGLRRLGRPPAAVEASDQEHLDRPVIRPLVGHVLHLTEHRPVQPAPNIRLGTPDPRRPVHALKTADLGPREREPPRIGQGITAPQRHRRPQHLARALQGPARSARSARRQHPAQSARRQRRHPRPATRRPCSRPPDQSPGHATHPPGPPQVRHMTAQGSRRPLPHPRLRQQGRDPGPRHQLAPRAQQDQSRTRSVGPSRTRSPSTCAPPGQGSRTQAKCSPQS